MKGITKEIISNAFKIVNVANFVKRKQSSNQYKLFINSLSPDMKEIIDLWTKYRKQFYKDIKG